MDDIYYIVISYLTLCDECIKYYDDTEIEKCYYCDYIICDDCDRGNFCEVCNSYHCKDCENLCMEQCHMCDRWDYDSTSCVVCMVTYCDDCYYRFDGRCNKCDTRLI